MIKNKTILITGATDGIGKQTAIELASFGAKLIIHGRNEEICKKSVDDIVSLTGNQNINHISADLSSLAQVCEMAEKIISSYEKLDVLINSAGVYENEKIFTIDGYETTFAVNHLAHFLLTFKLLNLLELSSPSRIINVSSIAHTNCEFDLKNLNSENFFSPYNSYALSKAANILFTYKLASDLVKANITVNSLHPGVITTKLLQKGFGMKGASLSEGAETSVYLASSNEVENITGKYFVASEERTSASFTYDEELQQQFWDISYKMIEKFL